jgi:asparagine synthase (glutamine-hydrolysing)
MLKLKFHIDSIGSPTIIIDEMYAGLIAVSEGPSKEKNLEMTVIEYMPFEREVILRSAIGNPLPLFWAWRNDGALVISDSIADILDDLGDSKNIDSIDKVGLIESILFDGPLNERTLFQSVKKVQMAEMLVFSLGSKKTEKSWRWIPRLQTDLHYTTDNQETMARHQIEKLSFQLDHLAAGVTLPITGGLDSRLLATLLRSKTAAPIHSYTFQRGWSYESWCAKKVARQLKTEHKIYNLDERCYREFARDVVKKTGGMITGMHTHGIYCCEYLLPEATKKIPRIFGYFGDPVTGAMTENINDGLLSASSEAIFRKYQSSSFDYVIQQYRDEIIADLDETKKAFELSGSPKHCFHEFWKIQQRQNNVITHLFQYHRGIQRVLVYEPFINQEFIDFFLGLPLESRYNRKLFKKAARDLFPDTFSMPSMHYSKGSFMAKVEHIFESLESVANKVKANQEFVLSPFKYEQHEKNIMNYLMGDIQLGRSIFEELFSFKLPAVELPLWKGNSTAQEHYRLAALGYLLT